MINVDLTTKNTVYNTLGPQAQWIQHRFGRRDYPDTELKIDDVLRIIESSNKKINFNSYYGDPSSYSNILTVIENIQQNSLVFNTHLSFQNDSLISLLNRKNAYVVVPLFGINELNSKIILHSDWNLILKNLNNLTCDVCLEFYEYDFNKHQITEIYKLAENNNINVKINKGICTHILSFSPIVDEAGNWLYDAYVSDSDHNALYKSVNGYNSLIQFIKPVKGRSILDNPMVFDTEVNFSQDSMTSITVTGEVFPSEFLARLYSNALCTDWNLAFSKITREDKVTIKEDLKDICAAMAYIIRYLKKDNNIYKKNFADILANLTDSYI